jgi:hypothetical protein
MSKMKRQADQEKNWTRNGRRNEVNWDKENDFYERSRTAHPTASERAFEEGIAEECGLWHSAERDVVE